MLEAGFGAATSLANGLVSSDSSTSLARIPGLIPDAGWAWAAIASKETKRKIRDEARADQARYDDVTRRLQERIDYYGRMADADSAARRESS